MGSSERPLTRASIEAAHALIKPHIHSTPVLTNTTLSNLASTPQTPEALHGTPWEGQKPATPKVRLFFKCENFQRIGAFKVRGAFHAVIRLIEEQGIEEVRRRGVVTHSSGNHAQALALAAKTFSIPAHIVMPKISTPSKIAGTQAQGAIVHFSGSTSQEREAVVADVVAKTGATLIPPYDHPDIILGQGTMALELQEEAAELMNKKPELGIHGESSKGLDALIAPCGGGGMLSGNAIACHDTGIKVFGAEPSFEGGDDARRGVAAGERVTTVKTLTIADGLRTPLGEITWKIISDATYVASLYGVTEQNIKDAMKLVLERMKCFVEPSAVVGLATILYNEDFRKMVEREAGEEGWNIGVVFSGGNTTIEAITKIFADVPAAKAEREEGAVGSDGRRVAENVAG
ncbi:tryptophan synthase beta subunit-like PLP-dependent enzyme [Dothidotthia symphoricarpi CBS 119687]|uniref:Tryptophan synthase beta subunit-like PLP-dependent enzyme n=1 Tax=Dothidotthia symphoricarpi CBS 119687 TaxID=1392245 RepID=A0A6A6A3R4_9PLEO|nr:tryptophan synthase beta subunit-like PLP-dependent enzyme [Dothidotthia symphoricarpi CBS 119687]KAF2125793.1 tryptophan synthase beta subunit-like PLP-dependent enzyme [Dothidotthia symphoricarpi CBS 119687]